MYAKVLVLLVAISASRAAPWYEKGWESLKDTFQEGIEEVKDVLDEHGVSDLFADTKEQLESKVIGIDTVLEAFQSGDIKAQLLNYTDDKISSAAEQLDSFMQQMQQFKNKMQGPEFDSLKNEWQTNVENMYNSGLADLLGMAREVQSRVVTTGQLERQLVEQQLILTEEQRLLTAAEINKTKIEEYKLRLEIMKLTKELGLADPEIIV